MKRVILSLSSISSLCLLFVLLNITTPVTAGPFGVISIFILAYISILGFITYIIYYFSKLLSHLSAIFIMRKPLITLSMKRSYYFSTVISAIPILLVGLQSVGKIGIYEYILVFIFGIIGCVYVYKKIY